MLYHINTRICTLGTLAIILAFSYFLRAAMNKKRGSSRSKWDVAPFVIDALPESKEDGYLDRYYGEDDRSDDEDNVETERNEQHHESPTASPIPEQLNGQIQAFIDYHRGLNEKFE
jgi:hypothetical protein